MIEFSIAFVIIDCLYFGGILACFCVGSRVYTTNDSVTVFEHCSVVLGGYVKQIPIRHSFSNKAVGYTSLAVQLQHIILLFLDHRCLINVDPFTHNADVENIPLLLS